MNNLQDIYIGGNVMKKVFLLVIALGIFICTSVICVHAAGTYNRPCSNCSGTGQITTSKQVFGTCYRCAGRLYVRDESASRICFTCGSRNYVFVPGGDYGGFIGSAHYLCRNCGSDEVYKGYPCTTCDGAGVCYNTVITKETCKVCDGSGSIPAVCYNHSYGSAEIIDSEKHSQTCSTCGYIEKAYHSWNSGTVTKHPTCKESGSKTYSCTVCGAAKTETLPNADHSYGAWSKEDDDYHTHTCIICQESSQSFSHTWGNDEIIKQATCKEAGEKSVTCTACYATKTEVIPKLSTHTYDHDCDKECNVCGATRTTTHHYGNWRTDANGHWKECSACKGKKDFAAHIPGAEPTETTAQTCTACGYVIKPPLSTHGHSYSYWTTNKNGHCHICIECGEKLHEAAHAPGAEATTEAAQTCTVCGYEIAPALREPTKKPTDSTVPDKSDDTSSNSFPWWIVAVISGVTAIIIVCLILKKAVSKKAPQDS